ncbi:MAG: glycosyltransferase family 4 protein [Patescibacteria group bacterium]
MKKPKIAIVRGTFLNKYEMQMYEPLVDRYDITAFGCLTSYHDKFAFPVVKLPSPMDLSEFPYKMPVLNRLFIDAHYLWGLEEKLRGFDIVHTAETYFHYTQQCLNAKGKAKVIATVLENIPFNNEGIWGRKAFKARARRELDHIVALTHKTKEALIAEGADTRKMSVIPHFIDTKRFLPETPRKTVRTILFCGRLEEYKGVFDFVAMARQLPRALRFVMVGTGSEQDNLRRAGMEVRSVSYDDMPAIYREADIFVAPSKPSTKLVLGKPITTWEEQYCTVLLEAQAAGLPIVTTRTGGIPENIGDAGIIVAPGDVNALTHAVQRFIDNTVLRLAYSKKARARAVSVHDITIGANKIDLLYQKLL